MIMCHLLADTLDELHLMAACIGVAKKHFQSGKVPHYDICKAKRELAVKAGAWQVDRRQCGMLSRVWRQRMATGRVSR